MIKLSVIEAGEPMVQPFLKVAWHYIRTLKLSMPLIHITLKGVCP